MVEAGGQIKLRVLWTVPAVATNETKISRLGACHIFFRQLLKTAWVKVATVVLPLPQATDTGTTWNPHSPHSPHSPASKGPLVKRK